MKAQKAKPTLEIVLLAAGLGTRMKSQLPKVLHTVCDTPMLGLLLNALSSGLRRQDCPVEFKGFNVVIGHGRDLVKKAAETAVLTEGSGNVRFTVQDQQLGTGHAVKLALENSSGATLTAVFNGDLPLFTPEAFADFLNTHFNEKSFATLGSATLDDPAQYGRIVRKGKNFSGVVEFKDANAAQRRIREINGGVYLFDTALLKNCLGKLKTKNAAQEFYLPDVFEAARKQKKKIYAHLFEDSDLLRGVNDMKERAEAQKLLYWRTAVTHMKAGVFLPDPSHTFISPETVIGKGCTIAPFSFLQGNCVLGDGVDVGPFCQLRDVTVESNTLIRAGVMAEKAWIGADCAVGPMAHFRPGTRLKNNVRVGNFVEVKESTIGEHTNAAHLSYIGDAEIGSGVNIGCGFVTCNYDGRVIDGKRKHKSIIGNNVFIGSDSQVVAPIKIADGTFIASGSTVSESVPEPDSLVIARTKQVTKPGYAKKYKK